MNTQPRLLNQEVSIIPVELLGGAIGVVVSESVKWNKSWKDQYNIKRKVLLINTSAVNETRKNAEGNLLSRKQVTEFLGEKYAHLEAKELTFESIVALIKKMNTENPSSLDSKY
jgi:hypothetical protein